MLLPFLKELLNSTKPLHVMVGALFLMMGGALQHVYAQQEKMSSNKADTLTIAQMLEQNKELIELQRQAQELQQSQHALATSSLLSLESRMLQADAEQKNKLLEVSFEQRELKAKLEDNVKTNELILKKLDALSKNIDTIKTKVE